jgi:hypothetical protein
VKYHWPRSARELEEAARGNVLTPLPAAENPAGVWESLDLSRKRAIIKTPDDDHVAVAGGKGAQRAFDPATVQITWHQQDGQEEVAWPLQRLDASPICLVSSTSWAHSRSFVARELPQ